jgi:hypothetical protein
MLYVSQIPLEAVDAAARFGIDIEALPSPYALPDGAVLAPPQCISVSRPMLRTVIKSECCHIESLNLNLLRMKCLSGRGRVTSQSMRIHRSAEVLFQASSGVQETMGEVGPFCWHVRRVLVWKPAREHWGYVPLVRC